MNIKDFSVPKVSGRIFYQYVYRHWPVTTKQFKAAIGINPNCASAYKQRGAVYFDKGKYRLARTDAAKARSWL